MKLNNQNLHAIIPDCTLQTIEQFIEPLNETLTRYSLNTPARITAFLAQIFHESGHLSAVEENLNYSAKGLLSIFSKYFDEKTASEYERNPAKIASLVYANRMGNGDASSGEGFKYKGRGLIQITGKDNYRACGLSLTEDLLNTPELLETPLYAALSAGWFWEANKLNALCDKDTEEGFIQLTKRINGGTHGLADRLSLWHKAKLILTK